jgi:hypothetical protein
MSSFLGERGLQAIGSEVAAETSRSAEMKAPAKIVAVSRIEVNVIGKTPLPSCPSPTFGPDAKINAWGVPI